MELNIISSSEIKNFQILWIEVETIVGGMVIQLGHAPAIIELKPQAMLSYCISSSGKVETIDSASGFIEISRSGVNLLLN